MALDYKPLSYRITYIILDLYEITPSQLELKHNLEVILDSWLLLTEQVKTIFLMQIYSVH